MAVKNFSLLYLFLLCLVRTNISSVWFCFQVLLPYCTSSFLHRTGKISPGMNHSFLMAAQNFSIITWSSAVMLVNMGPDFNRAFLASYSPRTTCSAIMIQ